MFYFSMISSSIEVKKREDEVKEKLNELKADVDVLVHWDKTYIDESNLMTTSETKSNYNEDYLELQRIINKILNTNT